MKPTKVTRSCVFFFAMGCESLRILSFGAFLLWFQGSGCLFGSPVARGLWILWALRYRGGEVTGLFRSGRPNGEDMPLGYRVLGFLGCKV